jgi:hypothetical protein
MAGADLYGFVQHVNRPGPTTAGGGFAASVGGPVIFTLNLRQAVRTVTLDTRIIVDKPTFHAACASAFEFPELYGRNMDAWIDCMSSLTDEHPLAGFRLGSDECLLLRVPDFEALEERVPEVARSLIACTAIVNRRYAEFGDSARIVLVIE